MVVRVWKTLMVPHNNPIPAALWILRARRELGPVILVQRTILHMQPEGLASFLLLHYNAAHYDKAVSKSLGRCGQIRQCDIGYRLAQIFSWHRAAPDGDAQGQEQDCPARPNLPGLREPLHVHMPPTVRCPTWATTSPPRLTPVDALPLRS